MIKKACSLVFFSLCLAQTPLLPSVNFSKDKNTKEFHGPASIKTPSKELKIGEKLSFDVYWMGLHVGIGSLEVKEIIQHNSRPAYHVIAIARTNNALSKIYPIYDEIHSKFDAENFVSYEFTKNLKEGRYRADEKVVFDHEKAKGFYESFLNQTKKEFEIRPGAQDFLSVFYWFRVQPVEVGRSVRAVISDKGKDYEVEMAVLRKQAQELRGNQVIWTMEVEPKTRYKEVLCQRGRGWVYFTIDPARIPVLIRIQTPFGPVTGVLKD